MARPHHFGDPCIHCGTPLDDVVPGPCKGDTSKAVPIGYALIDARWDGVQHYRIRYSDGRIEDSHQHVSFHAPYFHFGHSDELKQPPRYDEKLKHQKPYV